MTFVKSAGNNGNRAYTMQNESDLITSPGSASNIIVVGSTDNNGNYLSTFSSTQTTKNIKRKQILLIMWGE